MGDASKDQGITSPTHVWSSESVKENGHGCYFLKRIDLMENASHWRKSGGSPRSICSLPCAVCQGQGPFSLTLTALLFFRPWRGGFAVAIPASMVAPASTCTTPSFVSALRSGRWVTLSLTSKSKSCWQVGQQRVLWTHSDRSNYPPKFLAFCGLRRQRESCQTVVKSMI